MAVKLIFAVLDLALLGVGYQGFPMGLGDFTGCAFWHEPAAY